MANCKKLRVAQQDVLYGCFPVWSHLILELLGRAGNIPDRGSRQRCSAAPELQHSISLSADPFYSPWGHVQKVLSKVSAALQWLFSIFGVKTTGSLLLFRYIFMLFLNRFCSLLRCQGFTEIKPLAKFHTEREILAHIKSCIFNMEGTAEKVLLSMLQFSSYYFIIKCSALQ